MKKKSHILLWILCFSWLAFLLWMSSEDGVSTAYTSHQLSQLILKLFHLPQNQLSQVDQTIRTLAHFVGFFVMGGLAYTASKATWAEFKCLVFKVIIAGAVLAVLDEVKKLFITGRHLSWPEAGLNAVGIVCGVLLSYGIRWLITRVEKKRNLAANHTVESSIPH